MNIYSLYSDSVHIFGHKTAIIHDGIPVSYEELGRKERRLASSLKAMGIGKGSVVGLQLVTGADFVATFFSLLHLGAIVVPMGSRLNHATISQYITQAGIEYYIYSELFDEQINYLINEKNTNIRWIRSSSEGGELERLIEAGDEGFWELPAIKDDDSALYLFTSGTTDMSKVVVLSYYNLRMWVEIDQGNNYSDDSEVFLTYSPMNHAGGLGRLMRVICAGATIIMMSRFRIHEIFDAIEKERPTAILLIPPTHVYCFETTLYERPIDLSCIDRIETGATIVPPDAIKKAFELFPNARIYVGYGQSECKSITNLNYSAEEYAANPGLIESIGRGSHLTTIRLVDENGQDVPVGEVGEAMVKSPNVMKEYLGIENSLNDGWLMTGDFLRMDENGYYYFVDRKRDIIKSGGELVSSYEVEKVYYNHPKIKNCAVIGIPSKTLGEEIAIAIVMENGEKMDLEEIIGFGREHLPKYRVPRKAFFLSELPQTGTGKIRKKELKAQLISAMES